MGIRYGPEICEDLYEAIENNSPISFSINIPGLNTINIVLTSPEEVIEEWCANCDDTNSLICSGSGGGEACGATCDRDCRDLREQLVKFNFPSQSELNNTCSYLRRHCAFNIMAVHAVNPGNASITTLTKYVKSRRRDLKGWNGNWHVPSSPLEFFNWDLTKIADEAKYVWLYLHPQAGKETTASTSLGGQFPGPPVVNVSGSVSYKFTTKDIQLYEELVEYYSTLSLSSGQRCSHLLLVKL